MKQQQPLFTEHLIFRTMYKRFLNNNDYIGIITEEALVQLIRGNEERLAQVEEAAESSIVEYLIDNYEIENVLAVGKNITQYNPQIIYPVGAHFYHEGKIWEAMRSINGYKAPQTIAYWNEYSDFIVDESIVIDYSQLRNYQPGDIVHLNGIHYVCLAPNGIDFGNIQIPGLNAWEEVMSYEWQANFEYSAWDVVKWEDKFYTLLYIENVDWTINPHDSDNWGMIGDYSPDYQYEFSDTEYVVYEGRVWIPVINVNADELKEGYNIRLHDPRNGNVKKHMLRLALYELHKLISPNNVSSARITDYETSIAWLRDASRLKINPQIPRKLDDEHKPVAEFAIATFQRDYDPNKNPWQI